MDQKNKDSILSNTLRYGQIVETTSELIIICLEEHIQFINDAGIRLLGGDSKDAFIGKKLTEFIKTESIPSLNDSISKIKNSGGDLSIQEEIFRGIDGEELRCQISISPFTYQNNNEILIVGKSKSEPIQSENTFTNSETKFQSLVQNINEYIYSVYYSHGKAVSSYHSPKCLLVTGYSPEEYLKDPELWIKMVYEDDFERVQNYFNELKNNLKPTPIEHRITHKDGSVKWISNTSTVELDKVGELVRLDGFILDITDRKLFEEALQQQNLFLQKLIDTIPNPIFYKDTAGKYLGCNVAFERDMGFTREEILGKSDFELLDKKSAELYSLKDKDLIENPGIKVYDTDIKFSDGSLHNLIINKATYYNSDNSVGGIVGVSLDITKLKETQRELSDALSRLKNMELIINKGPAVVFLWNANESLSAEFVSDNINQFGYSAANFLSNTILYAGYNLYR